MKANKFYISNEPIRLFNSDFLMFFRYIRPISNLVIWLPVVGLLCFAFIRYEFKLIICNTSRDRP
jgi:hypothetical protein